MLLQDKAVIVSGIGPGLGHELAYASAREGAAVVLAARTESFLEEVAASVRERGARALVACANAAIFFASDLSRVITGAGLDVNGGEFMP